MSEKNTQLSGTIHVDQDAVLKSKLYVEDDLNVGENTQLSGTIHVDQRCGVEIQVVC